MQYNQRFGLRMYNQTAIVQGTAQPSSVVITTYAQPVRGRLGISKVAGAGSISAVSYSVIVGVGAANVIVTVLPTATGYRSTESLLNVVANADGYAVRRRNGIVAVNGVGNINAIPFRLAGGSGLIVGLVRPSALGKVVYVAQAGINGSSNASGSSVVRLVGLTGIEFIAQSIAASVTRLTGSAVPQAVVGANGYGVYIVVDYALVDVFVQALADTFVFRWVPYQFGQKTWNEFLNEADIWRPVILPSSRWRQKTV